jgi:hypothetical protein
VRSELKTRELVNLPVSMNRNYQYLFRVLPGFTPPAEAHSVPSNPSRALVFNVNGASRSSNNIRIDGVSTTNIWLPHVAAYVPALESLETVNIVTNSFDAEQGLAGGSAINAQIKSGTNNLHGSAFEFHTNEKLRTQNYFAPPGTKKGAWRYNQYGGTVGGPVVRNKVFYFVSYEGTRDRQMLNRTVSVPTEALRRGDLRSADRRGQRLGADRVSQQSDPGRSHRSHRRGPHRADSASEPAQRERVDFRDEQLLRAGALRAEPFNGRQQGELECQQQPEHLRAIQRARLRDGERHGVRRHAAGPGDGQQQSGKG